MRQEAQERRTGGTQRLDLEGIFAKRKADPYTTRHHVVQDQERKYPQGEGQWSFQKRGCTAYPPKAVQGERQNDRECHTAPLNQKEYPQPTRH
jgi:hypothetical protein